MDISSKFRFLSYKTWIWYFKSHVGLIFVFLLLGLFIWEGLVLKNTAAYVIASNQPAADVKQITGMRIDFQSYNSVVSRIQRADTFQPSGGLVKNPF